LKQEDQANGGFELSSEAAAKLIEKIGQGDRAALSSFYDKTARLIFGLVLRVLEDRAPAEEALLDIYTRVWTQSAQYDPGIPPLEWLMTIARPIAISKLHAAKRGKEKRVFHSANRDSPATAAPEQQKLARASMESLFPAQRDVLNQAYYSGLSCGEIAAQTGKPPGAAKTHARLGLNKLGDLLHPILEPETRADVSGDAQK
jgi:RNA polymerase sigma-70 factor (ECF subfamily)